MAAEIQIGGRRIGPGHPAYIVAEMSANHNRDYDRAVAIVRAAAAAGADAVKLQTYTADTMTLDEAGERFVIAGDSPWRGRRLYELYQEACTPWEWQPRLQRVADDLGIDLFSTPFDATAVDFLEAMDVPAYKVASFEIVDLPLIRRIAATGRPIVLSTGMATLAEIEEAVTAARAAGARDLVLLKCCSAYPAPPEEMNLRTIPHLAATFDLPVGLSDHTLGLAVPVAAVSLGALLIEKHLTLSRADPGPDSSFSLEPEEFAAMVEAVRTAERALGGVRYGPTARQQASLALRRSLFVVRDLAAGEVLTADHVRSIRPADGLPPRLLDEVLGRRARRALRRGTPLAWDDLESADAGGAESE